MSLLFCNREITSIPSIADVEFFFLNMGLSIYRINIQNVMHFLLSSVQEYLKL